MVKEILSKRYLKKKNFEYFIYILSSSKIHGALVLITVEKYFFFLFLFLTEL